MGETKQEMGDRGEVIRGRYFSTEELQLIVQFVADYFNQGRTRASIEICKALDWRQPNGWLKDRACRDVLRALEAKGFLRLPPSKSNSIGNKRRCTFSNDYSSRVDSSSLEHVDFGAITLDQVKSTKEEPFWNWLIERYHYLGFSVLVGRALKYLIRCNGRVIGAWGVSDCAWSLQARDSLLSSIGYNLGDVRTRVINNSRFLILPWVRIPNLASHLLSLAIKRAQDDWKLYYRVEPILLETFVETKMFLGTCYKAANWLYLGKTKGYRKTGQGHRNSQTSKAIFIYPLSRSLRAKIVNAIRRSCHGLPDS